MEDIGQALAILLGVLSFVAAGRIGWHIAFPISVWVSRKLGAEDKIEWHRGTATGRPPLRYIKDGWGRIVYVELDPDPEGGAP